MDFRGLMHSDLLAWGVGAFAVLVLTVVAFLYVGWLGVGLIGLVGLLISTRVDLWGGHAVADSGEGSGAVNMYAQQIEAAKQRARSEGMAGEEKKTERSRVVYLVNTMFIAMIVLGFGFFFLYQILPNIK